ncbi:MAG TPA: sugar transferase [Solirubrobacterales bacterium]|nr:sugar transferase [Solirubrobacterales bacterium]
MATGAPQLSEGGPYPGKRVIDLALVAILALPALLIAIPSALAIGLTSRGPIMFRQERIGFGGRPFQLLKFRTMVAGDNPVFPDATRITRVGRILRRLSLDEIPQLTNIVKGEMSVVGPRPTLAYQVERYDEVQLRRLSVRPGVTGWAQLQGRNEIPWAKRIELDIEYIDHVQSPLADVRILVRSIAAAARGGGVEGHPADDPLAKIGP